MIPDIQNLLSHSLKTMLIVFGIERNAQYFYKGQEGTLQNSQIRIRSQEKKILCHLSIGSLKLDGASFL